MPAEAGTLANDAAKMANAGKALPKNACFILNSLLYSHSNKPFHIPARVVSISAIKDSGLTLA